MYIVCILTGSFSISFSTHACHERLDQRDLAARLGQLSDYVLKTDFSLCKADDMMFSLKLVDNICVRSWDCAHEKDVRPIPDNRRLSNTSSF